MEGARLTLGTRAGAVFWGEVTEVDDEPDVADGETGKSYSARTSASEVFDGDKGDTTDGDLNEDIRGGDAACLSRG